jgi:hypothetical protein
MAVFRSIEPDETAGAAATTGTSSLSKKRSHKPPIYKQHLPELKPGTNH